jgi:hypothetical protein
MNINKEEKIIEVEAQELSNGEVDFSSVKPYTCPFVGGPIHRIAPKIGRNEYCSLENKKFKNCCGKDGRNFCYKMLSNFLEKSSESFASSSSSNESN